MERQTGKKTNAEVIEEEDDEEKGSDEDDDDDDDDSKKDKSNISKSIAAGTAKSKKTEN